MEAKWPRCLMLYEAFGQDPLERATKWRWLGYALSGEHVASTSIQHLRIEDSSLSASDVRHFIGNGTDSHHRGIPLPPSADGLGRIECVKLSPDACIFVGGEYWHKLSTLGSAGDDWFVVVDDSTLGDMEVMVPGFGVCTIQCDSIVDAVELLPSSTHKIALSSLQCGINNCELEALHLLRDTFGSTLTRLKLSLGEEIVLSRAQATTFVESFPLLEFLDLNHVSLGSMDILLSAYESGKCRVTALSMTNSFVEPASMTRFATKLGDLSWCVALRLHEFRLLFEDYHASANGACPSIITTEGAAAFRDALYDNPLLGYTELGLTQAVYDQYYAKLMDFDRVRAAEVFTAQKLALLSVFHGGSHDATSKKRRHEGVRVPRRRRRRVVALIFGFLEPTVGRMVSVICVPRD